MFFVNHRSLMHKYKCHMLLTGMFYLTQNHVLKNHSCTINDLLCACTYARFRPILHQYRSKCKYPYIQELYRSGYYKTWMSGWHWGKIYWKWLWHVNCCLKLDKNQDSWPWPEVNVGISKVMLMRPENSTQIFCLLLYLYALMMIKHGFQCITFGAVENRGLPQFSTSSLRLGKC